LSGRDLRYNGHRDVCQLLVIPTIRRSNWARPRPHVRGLCGLLPTFEECHRTLPPKPGGVCLLRGAVGAAFDVVGRCFLRNPIVGAIGVLAIRLRSRHCELAHVNPRSYADRASTDQIRVFFYNALGAALCDSPGPTSPFTSRSSTATACAAREAARSSSLDAASPRRPGDGRQRGPRRLPTTSARHTTGALPAANRTSADARALPVERAQRPASPRPARREPTLRRASSRFPRPESPMITWMLRRRRRAGDLVDSGEPAGRGTPDGLPPPR